LSGKKRKRGKEGERQHNEKIKVGRGKMRYAPVVVREAGTSSFD